MTSPRIFRVASRPITLAKSHHPPKFNQVAPTNARKFSTTPRRQFLDECLVQTHSLLTGIHDISRLSWATSIPLVAFLVRIVILHPLGKYSRHVCRKQSKAYLQLSESRLALEKKIEREHRNKSTLERQNIQHREMRATWKQLLRQNRAQHWRTYTTLVKIPIWYLIMETIRQMTGTEEGMLNLAIKPLAALREKQQDPDPSTTPDEQLIPIEPSLATEGGTL